MELVFREGRLAEVDSAQEMVAELDGVEAVGGSWADS